MAKISFCVKYNVLCGFPGVPYLIKTAWEICTYFCSLCSCLSFVCFLVEFECMSGREPFVPSVRLSGSL